MSRVYVSLDLETTGLDPEKDQITEVGAVKFRGDTVLEEFQSLINPGIGIPYQIQQLTGITNKMVAKAPKFNQIRGQLQAFVGNGPIVGHNVSFDLGFLRQRGMFTENLGVDTFELAGILLPFAGSFSLKALADYLDINEAATHRALDDARVAHRLFQALLVQAERLQPETIEEVANLGRRGKWALASVFKDLTRRRSFGGMSLGQHLNLQTHDYQPYLPPQEPIYPPIKLNVDDLAAVLEPDGVIDQTLDSFEYRPQQVEMLRTVADAFNEGYHVLIEAGTGTGKSIAYLLPAIQWAVQNNQHVVISTNTINLQDQLLNKDIPALKKSLNIDFSATTLKGRGNYVCQWRVNHLKQKADLSPLQMRLLAKVTVWLPNTVTGDRQELFMPNKSEQMLWNQVNANNEICPPDRCAREGCFFAAARQKAETAHLIVINHALLLADIGVNNRAIPEYQYLVIDEAHHLEDNITNQLGFTADKKSIDQLLTDLKQRKGNLFATLGKALRESGQSPRLGEMNTLATESDKLADAADRAWFTLFKTLSQVMREVAGRPRNQQYDRKLRIWGDIRIQPAWNEVEIAWENCRISLQSLLKTLKHLHKFWDSTDSIAMDNWDELKSTITSYRQLFEQTVANLDILVHGDDKIITWLEERIQNHEISLHAAPLHVGDLVRQHLLEAKTSVVMTSATIRTDNSFDYVKDRLSAWEMGDIALGTPFDYRRNARVYIPTNMPEPAAANYQKEFANTIAQLALATQGRILVLFTAYSQLRATARQVQKDLADNGIVLFQQGAGGSRRQLIRGFKETEKAVLFGTRSFWEGVDIPGSDLSCVVIAKIPFAVPSDPVVQARSETFDNPFNQYSIPEAILHFRQGFGRLIRTRSDRGAVVVMDRRVLSKNYGRKFLESLPDLEIVQTLTTDLPAQVANWLNQDQNSST